MKVLIGVCIVVILTVTGFIFFNHLKKDNIKTYIYEAEAGILNGPTTSKKGNGYSGKGYVTDFKQNQDSVIFKANINCAGVYRLKIGYRLPLGFGKKKTNLSINGESAIEIELPESKSFTESINQKVLLNKGENIIQFTSGWGHYDLDYIKLDPISPEERNQQLVNPKATKETQALMNFLVENYSHKIISGQQNISEVDWIYKNVGKKPAIVGFDFLDYSPSRVQRGSMTNQVEEAIKWSEQGGIVTFSWHWNAPKDLINKPGKEWKRGFYTNATTFDIAYAMKHPESKDYQLLLRDIDAIAVQMKRLQKENVPILFRPLHEAEGGWFWWGAKGSEPAKELYKLMYNRLTYHHHINNLIWVWNSVSEDWYPGDKYVDIVSYDSYPGNGDYGTVNDKYKQLKTLVNNQKLITLSENGSIPNPNLLSTYQISWSWFLTWDSFIRDKNSLSHVKEVYNNPYVITLEDLPDLN
ncbi:glycosyl hydrolase [Priestia megaterium]